MDEFKVMWPSSLSHVTWSNSLLITAIILLILLIYLLATRSSPREALGVSQRLAYVALIIVFCLGSYSALAALLAVSWRQTNTLSEAQAERIFSELVSMEKPEPLTQINNMLRLADDSPNLFNIPNSQLNDDLTASAVWDAEEKGFLRFIEYVRSFQKQHGEVVRSYNIYITESVPNIVFNGTLEADKLRSYRLRVRNYQEEIVRELNLASREFTTKASNIESALRDNVKVVTARLNSNEQLPDMARYIQDHTKYAELNSQQPLNERLQTAFNILNNLPEEISAPESPKPLEAWGPLRVTVAWLIEPNSTDLLNVLGMVGFAILGSSLTTFVSAGNQRLRDPRIKDVIAVIIKGTTAALVVYLFIFGGFEVFSSAEIAAFRPNVFMLFLTCFLGAVFSDRIWRYAERRLINSLRQSPQGAQAQE